MEKFASALQKDLLTNPIGIKEEILLKRKRFTNKVKCSVVVAFALLLIPMTANASGKDLIKKVYSGEPPKDLPTIQEELDQLPDEVIDILNKNNVTVNVINKSNSYFSLSDGTICLAKAICPKYYVYSPGNKIEIEKNGYIECYMSNLYSYEYGSITHEVAHELDYLRAIETGYKNKNAYGYSSTEEWERLYKDNKRMLSEIDSLTKSNVLKSKAEGFAEAFRLAIVNPGKLKDDCPDVYEYICSIYEPEDSIVPDSFDYISYADKYQDLKKAFGYNKEKLYKHYLDYGIAEGRTVG